MVTDVILSAHGVTVKYGLTHLRAFTYPVRPRLHLEDWNFHLCIGKSGVRRLTVLAFVESPHGWNIAVSAVAPESGPVTRNISPSSSRAK